MRLEQVWESGNTVAAAYGAHCEQWVREEGCRRAGALRFEVTVTPGGDVTQVVVDRHIPNAVPGPARKVLGDSVHIVQTERWSPPGDDDVSRADIAVEFPGKPITMTAQAEIHPTADGSTERVWGEVKVRVPVLGRAVEPEIVKQIVRSLRIEMTTGLEWLAER